MLNLLQKSKAILGRNERDLKYVKVSLIEKERTIIDNKLKTKKLLEKKGIPVSKTLKIIKSPKSLKNIRWNTLPKTFVIKATHGTLGRGILIVFGKRKKGETRRLKTKKWIQADGNPITIDDIRNHIFKALRGDFSIGKFPDTAFIEERIRIHPDLKPYCKRGIPDIRVIVYNKIPVMAELRLPTSESSGLANLSQGGIGIGIDMSMGTTTARGVWRKKLIDRLPGKKKLPLAGIKIPFWKKILELAVETQEIVGINYLGIDIAIDREQGPIVIEVNAKPGLNIQIANLSPLKPRVEKVEDIKVKSTKHAIRLAQNLFGGDIEEGVEEVSGRKLIGITQPIEIIDTKENKHSFIAKIDTGALKTKIKKDIVKKLKLKINKKEEKPTVFLSFIMDGITIDTEVLIAEEPEKHEITIGRRDLKKFLIDPTKIYLKSKKVIRKKS